MAKKASKPKGLAKKAAGVKKAKSRTTAAGSGANRAAVPKARTAKAKPKPKPGPGTERARPKAPKRGATTSGPAKAKLRPVPKQQVAKPKALGPKKAQPKARAAEGKRIAAAKPKAGAHAPLPGKDAPGRATAKQTPAAGRSPTLVAKMIPAAEGKPVAVPAAARALPGKELGKAAAAGKGKGAAAAAAMPQQTVARPGKPSGRAPVPSAGKGAAGAGKAGKDGQAARRQGPQTAGGKLPQGKSLPHGSGQPKVELAPRRHVSVAPSIPLPVQAIPKKPSLQQRARRIEQRLTGQTDDFTKRYNDNFDMSWIYHDAALEGVVYTFPELAGALKGEEAGPVDSSVAPIYEAIRRQKAAIEYIRNVASKKRTPVNVDMIKTIYTILHPEEGDLKTVKYRRDVPQHRLYFHEYATPDKIIYLVRQVVEWLNDPETRKKVGTLRMAAKAHYDLARAYPFTTDSGKVARLFMNVLLMRGGLPPAIIHATERQRYYEALKAATPSSVFIMLRDSVENSMASIEKLLDEHETRKRAFVN